MVLDYIPYSSSFEFNFPKVNWDAVLVGSVFEVENSVSFVLSGLESASMVFNCALYGNY